MKNILSRFMSLLGYVPAPAKLAPIVSTLKFDIEVDSAPLDAAIATLDKASAAAAEAELALKRITLAATVATKALLQVQALTAVEAQSATAELAADPARDELLCQLRALINEIRYDRGQSFRHPYTGAGGVNGGSTWPREPG